MPCYHWRKDSFAGAPLQKSTRARARLFVLYGLPHLLGASAPAVARVRGLFGDINLQKFDRAREGVLMCPDVPPF
jgi:hypothetical protein